MAQLQPYEQYQPIDYDYVKQLPTGWQLWKIAHAFNLIGSGTTPESGNEKFYINGSINWINTGDLNDGVLESCKNKITKEAFKKHSVLKIYPKGTLLIAMYGATIGKVAVTNIECCTNQACCALSKSKILTNKFTLYWFIANRKNIVNLSYGGGQPNISQDVIKKLKIPVPPLDTQNRIVEYLDKKNNEIDRFIRNKEKLIALLEEERRIIILSNITGGNIDASSKNDWKIIPLRYCCKVIDCKHITPVYVSEGIPIVSPGELKPYSINYSGLRLVSQHDYHEITEGGRKPINGDILYSRNASVGSACFVDGVTDFCMGQDVCLIRSKKFNGRYLEHVLNSDLILRRVESILIGATIRRINISEIKKLNVPFPPIEIQNLICSKIEISTKIIGTAISKAQQEITSIKEYREALITDLVTGKRCLPPSIPK